MSTSNYFPSAYINDYTGNIDIFKMFHHHNDVTMSAIVPQVIRITIVISTVFFQVQIKKNQSSTSLAFVRGIYR